jgi:hypothetical protein
VWVKLPDNGGLLNLSQVMRFEVVNASSWEIRAVTTSGSTVVGTGYASAAAAQAALDAYLVWDLNA